MASGRMNHKQKKGSYRAEIEGTAARQLYAAPERREKVRKPAAVPHRHHHGEAEGTLSIPYCIFLAAACVLTLLLGAYYLQQQALATSSQKKIAALESELAELQKENADDLNRIETSIDLEKIRDIAINELGMIYATQDNVVLYKNTSHNYVSQYEDVPQEDDSLAKSIIKSE